MPRRMRIARKESLQLLFNLRQMIKDFHDRLRRAGTVRQFIGKVDKTIEHNCQRHELIRLKNAGSGLKTTCVTQICG